MSESVEKPPRLILGGKRRRNKRCPTPTAGEKAENESRCLITIGQQLRRLRLERELTLRSLADLSGLNVNTLSMIENAKTSPSVTTLQQLSLALEVPVTKFFEIDSRQQNVIYCKPRRQVGVKFEHGWLEGLGDGFHKRAVQPFLVHMEPNAIHQPIPIVHSGLEFVYCLEGSLTYTVGDKSYLLSPGDSLLFEADLPHFCQNNGAIRSLSLLVICPSDENDQPTERHFLSLER